MKEQLTPIYRQYAHLMMEWAKEEESPEAAQRWIAEATHAWAKLQGRKVPQQELVIQGSLTGLPALLKKTGPLTTTELSKRLGVQSSCVTIAWNKGRLSSWGIARRPVVQSRKRAFLYYLEGT